MKFPAVKPKRKLAILGSTGSIGTSTLKVFQHQQKHPEQAPYDYQLSGIFAHVSVDKLLAQALKFKPEVIGLVDEEAAKKLLAKIAGIKNQKPYVAKLRVLAGYQEIKNYICSEGVEVVMQSAVGFSGLQATLDLIQANKVILLANKESLVVGQEAIRKLLKQSQAKIIPVDSEHNAIFQALPEGLQQDLFFGNLADHGIRKILLTGSGGPFRQRPLKDFKNIRVEEALNHPNWSMGAKVTIDSSTMMNKGLEFIEAAVLFNCRASEIQTVIHPQSIIHSGVEYLDSSLVVQMGPTDMCVPIAYAMNYPYRGTSAIKSLDLFRMKALDFYPVDFKRYPNFKLAIEAYEQGAVHCIVLNEINEYSVASFLAKRISYLDIYKYNKQVVKAIPAEIAAIVPDTYEKILQVRNWVHQYLANYPMLTK